MTYDVQRWGMVYSLGEWDIEPKSDGPYVLAAHAIAHERAEVERIMALKFNEVKGWSAYRESLAYEQAIRDCIAAVERINSVDWACDPEPAVDAALRALLEKP
jgi:hypothetical protein